MKTALVMEFIALAYGKLLRPLLLEKVQSTETDIDDKVLEVMDRLFQYTGPAS